ncbi:MAG: cyclic-di-AMP receptor [Anaerolineae bacterium]|nr:cyclic-di-AMP receptor [Anaerolineae bacterium]
MKLLIAIVQDIDADAAGRGLTDEGFSVTRIGSTGGFFRQGNVTLLCGTPDDRVEDALDVLKRTCEPRTRTIPLNIDASEMLLTAGPTREIRVGGATVFIFDVERFARY